MNQGCGVDSKATTFRLFQNENVNEFCRENVSKLKLRILGNVLHPNLKMLAKFFKFQFANLPLDSMIMVGGKGRAFQLRNCNQKQHN